MKFIEGIFEKILRSIVAFIVVRGRGKFVVLGLVIVGAVVFG